MQHMLRSDIRDFIGQNTYVKYGAKWSFEFNYQYFQNIRYFASNEIYTFGNEACPLYFDC